MLEKIKRLDNNQVQATIETIEGLINKYKWHDRKIYPYSFGINVIKFLNSFKDFKDYTYMSKWQMIDELNGFIDIVNKWVEQEKEPKVKMLYNGKEIEVRQSLAELLKEDLE